MKKVFGIRDTEQQLCKENETLKLQLESAERVTNRTLGRMQSEIDQLKADKARLERALDRIGFYCAGSEFSEVSDFILRVKSGEEKLL